jgi:hypothetical protein
MRSVPPLVASLAGLLVGLWLLVLLGGGFVVLAGHLLARLVRTRWDHRHPQQAAVRQHTRQAHRLAAEWPQLAQTLRWATPTSGPASIASQPLSSWPTPRA